jgi:3-methyladenine DNA glycosylase/8-oxoguanine DNA glycosylase
LVRKFGRPAEPLHGIQLAAFPAPADVLRAGPRVILAIGLTRAKTAAICAVAKAASAGRFDTERLAGLAAADVEADLCSIQGVGPWTAAYFRMRTLGDPDACPVTDLGLVKAVRSLTRDGHALSLRAIARRAERWRPWRAYATLHLWHRLAGNPPPVLRA